MSERDYVPVQGLIDSGLQRLGGGVAAHRHLLVLDVPPHPFDQVQVWAVGLSLALERFALVRQIIVNRIGQW